MPLPSSPKARWPTPSGVSNRAVVQNTENPFAVATTWLSLSATLSGLTKVLPSQVVGVVAIVSLQSRMINSVSEDEVAGAERDQPLQLDSEVGVLVAVDVAFDDGLVVGRAGG